jgi:hypothetical protein
VVLSPLHARRGIAGHRTRSPSRFSGGDRSRARRTSRLVRLRSSDSSAGQEAATTTTRTYSADLALLSQGPDPRPDALFRSCRVSATPLGQGLGALPTFRGNRRSASRATTTSTIPITTAVPITQTGLTRKGTQPIQNRSDLRRVFRPPPRPPGASRQRPRCRLLANRSVDAPVVSPAARGPPSSDDARRRETRRPRCRLRLTFVHAALRSTLGRLTRLSSSFES